MPSAIGSNQGFAPQQTQIALSSSFSDIQLLSNFDAMELQGHVFIDAASDYRASFKLSIIKNGAGVYEIAASDIAGDDYLGSPIMSFQISGNYLQCKMDVASPTSGYVKFNIDTPTPALVGSSSLSIEGSNIVSEIPSSRLPEATSTTAGAVKASDYYNEFAITPGTSGNIRTITVTKPGLYLILFSTTWSDAPSDVSRAIVSKIILNGSEIGTAQDQLISTSTAADYGSASAQTAEVLAAGDVLVFNTFSVNTAASLDRFSISIVPLPYTSSMTGSIGTIS